ncbi:hypothetical protein, partial [Salmonella sp. SAL4448]|uniref:hypothetical protein n=1 Tax=Salmonella sp. SAL4448 TaxID=3159903 RepID=UPI00397A508F
LLRCAGDETALPPHVAALNLWADAGPARITGQEGDNGGHLALVWEDGRTRVTLRLPYAGGQPLELEAEDASGADAARRAADASA